ncbi:MAG: hypothetical protein COA50_01520 [Flavobacteriaceae bacterium]|nr:MAG: hypothetical protein COA50_01520 [Flavobacteriaceae bacterium]
MKKKHFTDLLPDYLDGLLDDIQKKQVETHLKKCAACTKELESLIVLFNSFDAEKELEPSDALKSNFYEALEQEKQEHSKVIALNSKIQSGKNPWMPNLLKIAASVALLICSFMLGKKQQEQKATTEIAALIDESLHIKQTAMLSLMENKSASRRIQGVNFIEEFTNPDETIVAALADRMLYDENTNVRLTAAEALLGFTASETVISAYISALKTEKDPGIQIAVIQILVQIQEKKAVAPLQNLLLKDDTQPFVKKHIESLLPSII